MSTSKTSACNQPQWQGSFVEELGSHAEQIPRVLFSAEHAGSLLPLHLTERLDVEDVVILNSHRGYDLGVHNIAKGLADSASAVGLVAMFSRLYIDPCRPLGDPQSIVDHVDGREIHFNQQISDSCFSQRQATYTSFFERFSNLLRSRFSTDDDFFILSLHTMSPVLDGVSRNFDIDILPNFGHQQFAGFVADALSNEGFNVAWESAYSLTRRHALESQDTREELYEPYFWLSRHAILDGLIPAGFSFRSIEIEVVQHAHLVGTPEHAYETGRRIGHALAELDIEGTTAIRKWRSI